jgi:WhiB family transcriptional regulator, redox-sensing transcriptional regulator
MEWRHRGACGDAQDPDLFFPADDSRPTHRKTNEAKAVCRRCPVQEQCGQWALESGQEHGVWGGLSERDRRKLLGRRRAVRVHQ